MDGGSISAICPDKSRDICAIFECEGLGGIIACIILKVVNTTPPAVYTPPGLRIHDAIPGTLTIYSPDRAPQSIPVQMVQSGSLIRM